MRFIFLLILVLLTSTGLSQNEANIWYFGNHAGLDFNSGSPVALTDGQLNTLEGCASIANTNGELLFYTDGSNVWDKTHQLMPNGIGLNGHPSSTNAALIVPKPEDPNLYFIFTLDERGYSNGLQYSEVDLSLNNGNGDITTNKNILIETPVTEKITAVKVRNENAYWVIAHRFNSTDFLTYKVTTAGVNTTPIVSSTGSYLGGNTQNAMGCIKVSPDGTKLAVANLGLWESQLFDFDDATGIVSNPLTILEFSTEGVVYGIEFSPNSDLLYVSVPQKGVFQFEVSGNPSDILNSQTQVGVINISNRSLQLGPDGKIYVAKSAFGSALDIIENPNFQGTDCNYITEGVYLEGRDSSSGLPPFIQSIFNVSFLASNGCIGNTIQFSSNLSQDFDTLIWDFGDGNTSTEEHPTHIYSTVDSYEVSLTVTVGSQTSTDTKTITIYNVPVVEPFVELKQCDNDLDGISIFNLTEVSSQLSINHLEETISFYETELDAENNENQITDASNYSNQIVNNDVVWARVQNGFGCYAISEVNLLVSTSQIPESFIREFYQCDDGMNTSDGIATFDFGSVNLEIEALFPAGQQLEINYYKNELDALLENDPINTISNYQNTGYPYSQNIYVRVKNALNDECLGFGHHITLNVNSQNIITEPLFTDQCDAANNGSAFFDTSYLEDDLSNGQNQNFTFTYEDEFGNLLPSPLPNPFEVSTAIYTVIATMTDNNSSTGCTIQTPIVFRINNLVSINAINPFIACNNNLDGQHTFDTSNLETYLFGGPQPDTEIYYTDGNGNLIPSPFPNSFTTGTQTVIASIVNTLNPDCYASYPIEFKVYPQPIANAIENDFVCDDFHNDVEYLFALSEYNSQILGTQSSSLYEVFYFESENNALNNTNPLSDSYLVGSTTQTVFARIQNVGYSDCFEITSFDLNVFQSPVAYQPENLNLCDELNDNVESVNLSLQDSNILNGQSATDYIISYYLNQEDAEARVNEQPNNFTNTSNPQTIYARVENVESADCYDITSFNIILHEQTELLMNDLWPICAGSTVTIIADQGFDYYTWSSGQTTRMITVNEPGVYTVTASNIYDGLVCSTEKSVTVSISDIATITNIETADWSQNNNSISVFVEGNGTYEYSLDGSNYQEANVFNNLASEEYSVYVRDKNGCGIASDDVYLMYYPKYFTPNGDGKNDYWQIKNSARESLNRLFIYDRYGKLIKELRPNDFGWDGTFKGNKLPSSDYWFLLERVNGKTYTGHFSLKR